MDAIKRKARAAKKAREAINLRFLQSLCARWGQFSTIAVWEIAALMQGCDPDNLQDVVINDQGDGVDLSHENRMVISAITVGDLIAFPAGPLPANDKTEVAVESLIPWLQSHGYSDLAAGLAAVSHRSTAAIPTSSVAAGSPIPAMPVQRFHAQEAAILAKLVELGFDPLNLPKNAAGKRGVKSQVKAALGLKGLWIGKTVFGKAWERLRGDQRIATQA